MLGQTDGSSQTSRQSGLTLLELAVTAAVLTVIFGVAASAFVSTTNTFTESQIISQLQLRAQHAMARLSTVARQAVTSDPLYGPLKPDTGVDSKVLRLRLIQSMAGGVAVYDNATRVYICGDDANTYPCQGVIIGRGPSLSAIYNAGKGSDDTLGTRGDDTSTVIANGIPAVELLLPDIYAPSQGDMLTINVDPAGRLITLTLRVNVQSNSGSFILPQDLVLQERVALLQ